MDTSTIELRRDALYEQVWSTPISRLAESYGLSDNGLRKVCKKLNAPTPWRGYWAKRRHGHNVTPDPLPELQEGDPDVHIIHRGPVAHEDQGEKEHVPATENVSVELDVPMIKVSSRLRAPHPLVAETRQGFRRPYSDHYGRSRPRAGLHLTVDESSVHRALRLLDALLKQAEPLGFSAGVEGAGRKKKSYLEIEGVRVHFRMTEKLRREERELKGRERSWLSRKWDYFPTGRLRIELIHAHGGGRKRWSDGKRQRLEDMLASVFKGMYEAACAKKKWHEELERKQRERQAAERRRREEQEGREAEKARRNKLEMQAERWRQSQTLSAYLDQVERQVARRTLSLQEQPAYDAWMSWARAHARRLDPLADGLPMDSSPESSTARSEQRD
jgi:hypothetical protein